MHHLSLSSPTSTPHARTVGEQVPRARGQAEYKADPVIEEKHKHHSPHIYTTCSRTANVHRSQRLIQRTT
ncbi:hypothetical protein VTO73DRAFT_9434 [Trametes versicolor]